MIKLYSTNCSKCKVLEAKLKTKNIEYNICTDADEMQSKNIQSVPMIELEDNTLLDFGQAVRWVNNI